LIKKSITNTPDLYKATLDYHDTDKYNGPANQIRIREYYCDFDCSIHSGIHVNHTAKGTLLTKTSIHARKTRNMALVYPKEGQPIAFILCLKSCSDKSKTRLRLAYEDVTDEKITHSKIVYNIPLGEELEGLIYVENSCVWVKIGGITLWIPEDYSTCYFGVVVFSVGDQVCILRN